MVSEIPQMGNLTINKQTHGTLIHHLNFLSVIDAPYMIEKSVVLDCNSFLSYKQTSLLQDEFVDSIVEHLRNLRITNADFFPSYKYSPRWLIHHDELMPITIRVDKTNVRNAISTIYNRWFDGISRALRMMDRADEIDTYPAILIQPHCDQEFSMSTRHPRTGKLMEISDCIRSNYRSAPDVHKLENDTITFIDQLSIRPLKIFYYIDTEKMKIIIRRAEPYNLDSKAIIYYVLSKFDSADEEAEDLLCLISPENIAEAFSAKYSLSANKQYEAAYCYYACNYHLATKGKAVFPWSNPETIEAPSILLATDIRYDNMRIIKNCCGAVFSNSSRVIYHRGNVCNRLGIPYLADEFSLIIDYNKKRALARLVDNRTNQIEYQEINEGDIICISGNKWSVGGNIIPCTETTELREELGELLRPYTDKNKLETIPFGKQIHISKLVRALERTGWKA